jgi:chaperonin cofactor prefoldin
VEQEAEEHKYASITIIHPLAGIKGRFHSSSGLGLIKPCLVPQSLLEAQTNTPSSRLVLETLTPLPGTRKCFRMINGVLIERTVSDVIPALQTNSEGLNKVLDDLVKQYKRQQEELEKWKVCLLRYLGHARRSSCCAVWRGGWERQVAA